MKFENISCGVSLVGKTLVFQTRVARSSRVPRSKTFMDNNVKVIRVPFMIPNWAAAQVLLPETIFLKRGEKLTVEILVHELVHVDQIRRMGIWRYWITYLKEALTHEYHQHPMEIEADEGVMNPLMWERAENLYQRYKDV